MKILVTGGAGFIGSHLVDKLLKNNQVVVIDDFSGGDIENVQSKCPIYSYDCRSFNDIDLVFNEFKPDVVYHLACNAAENKSVFSPVDITSRSYDAFIKVLTAGIRNGMKKFVFTSSIAVYGTGQAPYKETDKPEPEDLYGITKYSAEETLKLMAKVHGFEYVILRPHNVFGERQNMKDPYRNVVTIFMNSLLIGDPLPIYGDGEQVRQFSYIDGVVKQIMERPQGTWNVGSSKEYTINQLADTIEKVAGFSTGRNYLPERMEVKRAVALHDYETNENFEECIAKTWSWAKKTGPQKPIYTELEIQSDLIPKNWI